METKTILNPINLKLELARFHFFAGQSSPFFNIEEVGPSILRLTSNTKNSPMTVGVLALVHGNETLGLPIVNKLIESLLSGQQVLDYDLYFGLGNIPAAFADQRFLEEDLNRCFGIQSTSAEGKRAQSCKL